MSRSRRTKIRLPRNCPINYDFSSDRIECKTCRYFDVCLKLFAKAKKLAQNLR